MHTKEKIGTELKSMLNNKVSHTDISKWALDLYLTDVAANDPELDGILSTLMMLNEGPNFELSNNQLMNIANILLVADSPIYTRQKFGLELKEKIKQKESVTNIAKWSHDTYYEMISEIDPSSGLRNILLTLAIMEMGPEFERSYEELNQIADKLIAGEDVKL